jgi:hypothetical protein
MQKFKQNETTATYRRIYMFLANISDGYTPVTSLVGAQVRLYKNGVAFGSQPTTPATLTHISLGHWYYEIPSAYLSDLGILTVTVEDSNIRNVVLMADVVTYDPTTSTGITAADVWSYVTRDLTGSVTVGTINANVITATSIASNAITSAKIADASLTAAKFGDSALVIGSAAAGGVKAYLDTGSITAGVIATNAIDADALATDAVTEIVNAVMTVDPSTFPGTSSGYWLYEAGLNSQQLLSDTNYINSTLYVESIADTILGRNVGGGSNAGRLVKEALYALRNKSEIVGTTLSVYDASDALSWTATVASSSSADPVTGIDP